MRRYIEVKITAEEAVLHLDNDAFGVLHEMVVVPTMKFSLVGLCESICSTNTPLSSPWSSKLR